MSSQIATSSEKSICRLCGRQFAKYNCPSCNVAYCSLTCFRSETHTQCSETFYKKEVATQIQSEPSKTLQERMKMMELLKKFEEENTSLDSEGEDDMEDLAHRFADVDLDATSAADVWSKLTPAEQAGFLKIMEDPNSDNARQLLASEELENERREPWWDAAAVEPDGPLYHRYGSKPELFIVPVTMIKPLSNGPLLHYNVCAVCIAYAFVIRHLSVSPLSSLTPQDIDYDEAKRLISQLVPFLVDRKSTVLHPNLSSLATDIWSRFKPGQVSSELFAVLLKDVAHLICPLPVTGVTLGTRSEEYYDAASHPHLNTVLALSDLAKLFEHPINGTKSHITHKLLFYTAHIISTPSWMLHVLAEDLAQRSAAYQTADNSKMKMELSGGVEDFARTFDKQKGQAPVIEEI